MQTSGSSSGVLASSDPLTASVLHFLHAHDAVCNVQIIERAGSSSRDIAQWERANGVSMPADLRSFYSITDGWQLRWSVRRGDAILPIGNLRINPLAQLKRVHMARFRIRDPHSSLPDAAGDDENDMSSDEEEELPTSRRASASGSSSKAAAIDPASFPRAFDLDSTCASGLIVLLYASPASAPVVHLIDRAGALHPIGSCFADFFRAALMHVGVPHWPCAYGDAGGLPDDAAQWLRFLSPQRLAIDQAHARTPGRTNAAAVRTRHHAQQHAAPSTNNKAAAVASSAVAFDLAKIEELAQSLLSLTTKPS